MMTPYEKRRPLPGSSHCLKAGIAFKQPDACANEMTGNDTAEQLNHGA